ncbi:hypothetical protein CPB85DRAFT_1430893 [Mucidula mucida]|nr:hypothetical protein CPB85DRAFT_1430893 [Mucidula mucida]
MTSSSSGSPSSWLPISWTTIKLPQDESNPDAPKTRISFTVAPRLLKLPPLLFAFASVIGFTTSYRAGLVFYQKTKNYRVALAGLKGAGKEGLRGIAVLGDYPLIGELARNSDEVAAGVTMSAAVSVIYRLGWRTGARTVALGGIVGGALQALKIIRGQVEKWIPAEKAAEQAVLDAEASSLPDADSATTTPSF